MPLEIQDSDDDEFAVTSPTRPDEEDELKPVASRTKSTDEATSRDRLMRDIQLAQQQLIRSSPARSTHTPLDPTSSPPRANKRRKTTNSSQVSTPEKKLGRRKTVKTYGSTGKRTRGLLDNSISLFDELKADEQKSTGATLTQREELDLGRAIPEKSWGLPVSVKQDFQEHEPVSMFPDPSSTVPDNTMTQQRLIEGALSNQMPPPPVQQIEEATASTASTIPWSTYTESPEHKAQTPLKITQISQMLIPEEPVAAVDPKLLTKNTLLHVDPSNTPPGSPVKPVRLSRTPTSSSKKPNSGKLRRTKTIGAISSLSRSPGDMDDELSMDKPKSTARRRKSHAVETQSRALVEDVPVAPKAKESVLAKHPSPEYNLNEEVTTTSKPVDLALAQKIASMLSTTAPDPPPQMVVQTIIEIAAPAEKQKSKEKAPAVEAVTLDSDELVIGLPEEQYKPRPSRSRSTIVAEDTSIDYSKRPEKAAKSRLKRRKTTNEISLGSPPSKVEEEKMAQIGSMGFTPRQTKAALIESSGNIAQAVDNLIARSSGGKENSPSKRSKTRSKSTKVLPASTTPSQFVTVQVTQGSGDKTCHPTVYDVEVPKHRFAENQEKAEELVDKIEPKTTPLPPAEEEVHTKKMAAQKRRRDKVVDSDEEDDIVAEPGPPKSMAKPVTKRKIVDSDDEDDFTIEPELPRAAPKPAAKRTKSLPAKRPRNQDEKDDLAIAVPTLPAKEAKRGRGRPKTVVQPVVDVEPSEPHVAEPVKKVDKVTAPKSPEPEKIVVETVQPQEQMQTPASTPKDGTIPTSTPEQHSGSFQKNAAIKAAVQHSPLNKSKVPLRVGLSRKKRIAPLLKIIKK